VANTIFGLHANVEKGTTVPDKQGVIWIDDGTGTVKLQTNAGGGTPSYVTLGGTGGTGDMAKATYDTDNDGIVDKAEAVDDGVNSKTAAQIKTHIDSTSNPHAVTAAQAGAIADAAGNGMIARTAANTATARTLASGNTAITVSNGDGVAGAPTFTLNGYTFKGFQRYTSGSGTYSTPANVRAINVKVWGPGGGGGGVSGAASNAAAAGGGGAGGYAEKWIASPSASYAYNVAAGGTGGSAGANNGNASATDTTFGSPAVVTGGKGGVGIAMAAGNTVATAAGGAGGTGTGGDINIAGGSGENGMRDSGTISHSHCAGISPYCVGMPGTGVLNAAGNAATGYGAGGGGASTQGNTNRAGGNGAGGLIEIWEYY